MIKLLNLEYLKFKKNSVIRMLLWVYVLAFPAILFIGKEDSLKLPNMMNSNMFFKFPTVWDWLGYDGNWMVFFCFGFIVVYSISMERNYKTMRQSIINGMTRQEFLLSKFLIVVMLSLFATLYYLLVGFIVGWYSTPNPSLALAMDNEWAGARFFLMSLGYLSFAYMIGILIKNSGLAVLTYLAYGILLEPLIRYFGHGRIFPDSRTMHYYPFNAMEDLMPLPFIEFTEAMSGNENESILLSYTEAGVITTISIIVCLGISYWYFTTKDL